MNHTYIRTCVRTPKLQVPSPAAATLAHCAIKDLHTNNGIRVENDAQEQTNTVEMKGGRTETMYTYIVGGKMKEEEM